LAFSDKLKYIRNELRLSQDDLAGQLGVSRQSISKWESGAAYPEIDKLIMISNFFEVSIDYLLKDSYAADGISAETIDRTVLKFLASSVDMESISKRLVSIAEDGEIDSKEMKEIEQIAAKLDGVVENIRKVQNLVRT